MLRRSSRLLTALGVAAAGASAVLAGAGLLIGRPIGAADNTDGIRLYGGAGLVPDTADRRADWKGGVVVEFTRGPASTDPIPSAALLILRAAAAGRGRAGRFSLVRLGRMYAGLTGVVAGVAAWALAADGPVRTLVMLPVVAPLADRDFARMCVSTYSEPAGLLGAVSLLGGTAVLTSTARTCRAERAVGLALACVGGLLASTAKIGYSPLLLVAAAVATAAPAPPHRGDRIARPLTAAAMLAVAVRPVVAAIRWQSRYYPGVNTHNLVFTMLLPELGPGAAGAVGLPPDAAAFAGHGSSDEHGVPVDSGRIPGWETTIGAAPGRVSRAAYRELLRHPAILTRAVGIAMRATHGRGLDYLADAPMPPGVRRARRVTATGSMGHDGTALRTWLDSLPNPSGPALFAALGLASPLVRRVAGRRGQPEATALTGIAAASSAGAVGIAALAVLGDGYYEIAKHVWLSAFLLDVTAGALIGAALAELVAPVRRRGLPAVNPIR